MRDWHIHLERGPYTVEWAEQFVRWAEKLGIREICLLEHSVRFLSSTHLCAGAGVQRLSATLV